MRSIYAAAGFTIRKKTQISKLGTIKEMTRAHGENPEQPLSREALCMATYQQLEMLRIISYRFSYCNLGIYFAKRRRRKNAYLEWCYGQDLNLRTPEGKDFPFGRFGQSVKILSPSPLT
jgi:hypothetical protein